jgi:hypothetical protein
LLRKLIIFSSLLFAALELLSFNWGKMHRLICIAAVFFMVVNSVQAESAFAKQSRVSVKLSRTIAQLHVLPTDHVSLLDVPYSPIPKISWDQQHQSYSQKTVLIVGAVAVGIVLIVYLVFKYYISGTT